MFVNNDTNENDKVISLPNISTRSLSLADGSNLRSSNSTSSFSVSDLSYKLLVI